ncbi:hypothetical protein ABB37_03297 [Leptomonas pyrrhocoris]|uniref:Calponin-homology (CH) domain-containing protein n=1 Tax=Leptomonas pyrrhocoris TaxID=157538 RepID=A0A0N0DWT2_LEPPY|nr:hypothetical protein ABB37_03297 [Leptomonas pyrrhocoris]KPA82168.1 hypothetical protein ABB37_03297 [Leptomonas pyrrhocoris]|eukprot:XP_015660607.1 hypothetical protein ABB37_03297 [Leptomonas pyrrhocoris]
MAAIPFSEEDLHELYTWVDEIPISRSKRNIARDFADGCSVAEILKFFFPKLVDLHNYVPAMSHEKKLDNWNTLNAKVLRKLYFEVPAEEVEDIVSAVPGAIERFLRALRMKIAQIKQRREEMRAANELQTYEQAHFIDYPTSANGSARGSRGPSAAAPAPQAPPAPPPPPSAGTPPARSSEEVKNLSHLVREKDYTIQELRETVSILSEKIVKLEELVRVKDEKLTQYREKFGRMPA